MTQCTKKRYQTEKHAKRGLMNLWGSDPTADINDLHVYPCPYCKGFYHVGHKSKYEQYLKTLESRKSNAQ